MNTAGDRLWSAVELAMRLGLTDWCDWEAARRNGVIPKPDIYLTRTRPRWKDRTIRAALGDAVLEDARVEADPSAIMERLRKAIDNAAPPPSTPPSGHAQRRPILLAAHRKVARGRLQADPPAAGER